VSVSAPEDPPGFVVRIEAGKAAWDNRFRLERDIESGGWPHYARLLMVRSGSPGCLVGEAD
jgi:hypothetical protein